MVMYTLLYVKWITNKDYCIAHETLPNVNWQPRWEVCRKMGTFICMAEFLCSSHETVTILLIGYTSKEGKIF